MATSRTVNQDFSKDYDRTMLVHIGIIMDGNGRWAKKRLKERSYGHLKGIAPVKNSLVVAIEQQVKYVTLYVFSTENWKRPKREVKAILDEVSGNLREHYDFYRTHGIKVVHSGDRAQLNKNVLSELDMVVEETKNNEGLVLNLAFNYGGRDEIIRAFNAYLQRRDSDAALTEEIFEQYLDNPQIPDIDLMIRTGEEKRISNFMLWRISYSELYFSDVLWPDWSQEDMAKAIDYYKNKQRRFGGVK